MSQTTMRALLDESDDRRTPRPLFDAWHAEHRFTVDAAATAANTLLPRFFADGLSESWSGERVYCNPPYSDIRPWVEKAHRETVNGCELAVLLLPARRTEQPWWQALIEPCRDRRGGRIRTRFLPGRIRFEYPDGRSTIGTRPTFGCVLITFSLWST